MAVIVDCRFTTTVELVRASTPKTRSLNTRDHHGQPHVRASNRVAVYAPRFGSVQVVEGANSGIRVSHAIKTTEFSTAGSMERQERVKAIGQAGRICRSRLTSASGWRGSKSEPHSLHCDCSPTTKRQSGSGPAGRIHQRTADSRTTTRWQGSTRSWQMPQSGRVTCSPDFRPRLPRRPRLIDA